MKFELKKEMLKKADEKAGFSGEIYILSLPSGAIKVHINDFKLIYSGYFTSECEIFKKRKIPTIQFMGGGLLGTLFCGDAIITMNEMGYDLTNDDDIKKAKKQDREKIVAAYETLVKEKPELFDASKIDLNKLEVKDGLNCFICKNEMEILLEEFEKKKKKYKGKEDEYLDALTLDVEKKEDDEVMDMFTEKGAHKAKKKSPSFIKDEAKVAYNLNTDLDWFRNYYHLENHHRYHYFSEKFYGITSKKSIVLCSVCKGYLEYCGYQPPYNLAYSRLTSVIPDMFKRDRFGNPENILKNTQYLFENVKHLKDTFIKCFNIEEKLVMKVFKHYDEKATIELKREKESKRRKTNRLNNLKKNIIKLLKQKGVKMPASDIDAHLKNQDVDEIKELCEEMYHNGEISRTGNYRYFILTEEKKKPKPKNASAAKPEKVDVEKELEKLKGLLDKGLITQEMSVAKAKELLGL